MRAQWIALVALTGLMYGCGKEPTETPAANSGAPAVGSTAPAPANMMPSTQGASVTLAALDAVPKAARAYNIVLIVKTRNNPFFKPMIDAFEQTSRELGAHFETEAPPQESDSEKQVAYVQTVMAKGVDAIVIAPADSKAIVPALKAAQDKGVVVVNLDNRVDGPTAQAQGLKLGGYVGADNAQGGKMAGDAMVTALGSGKVAVLEGIRGADNAEARKRGFTEAVQGKLDIAATETANWDTSQAYAKTQNILAAHPDIRGIFCANDKMAVGAMKAVSEKGLKGKLTLIGYDNIPDVQPALGSGELAATIEQHPDLMGKYGVRMAIGILDHKIQPGGEILVPLEVIKKK